MSRKKHRGEYILTMVGGIILITNSLSFIANMIIPFFQDESLERFRLTLGDEGFRLLQIRVIVASIISGSMLIILAIAMERNPKDLTHFGIMTIIVSIVSIIGIGLIYPVSIIATLVGIAGGSMAIIGGRKGVITAEVTYKEIHDIDYLCTICNLRFGSDDELRRHMLKHIVER